MKAEFSSQYKIGCLAIDGTENADLVIEAAFEAEATMPDIEGNSTDYLFCIRFPNRPQELYTEVALRRSLRKKERE